MHHNARYCFQFQCKGHSMDSSLRIERRHFLGHAAAAGVAIGASTSPALTQERTPSSASASRQISLGETLARYASGLKYEDLPEDVVRLAKRAILDTFGCAFGGCTAGPSKIAIQLANEVGSKQAGATVLCSGFRTTPDLAVFANGVMIRYLDFNDA